MKRKATAVTIVLKNEEYERLEAWSLSQPIPPTITDIVQAAEEMVDKVLKESEREILKLTEKKGTK